MNQKPTRRRGQSLLLLLLVILALAGVMALTIDFGFVLLSRRSMQTAVDSAALEGARNVGGQGRLNASRLVQNIFDDDLDPTANPTTLGAGVQQSLVGRDTNDRPILGDGTGLGDVFDDRASFMYRPVPQLNEPNLDHGDLGVGNYIPNQDHQETSSYVRNDFEFDPNGDSFLARLRRTSGRENIRNDLDRVPGVSSSGLGSPLLIGHLAFFRAEPPNQYDIRRDGVTIRATSIATGKPIVRVGLSDHADLFSAIEYAYLASEDEWYEIDAPQDSVGDVATRLDSDPSDPDIDPVLLSAITEVGYAAVIAEISGNDRVVGFRLVNAATGDRLPNGSSRLSDAWEAFSNLDASVRDLILQETDRLDQAGDLERVPALVRSMP